MSGIYIIKKLICFFLTVKYNKGVVYISFIIYRSEFYGTVSNPISHAKTKKINILARVADSDDPSSSICS